MDLFASLLTAQLLQYISWGPGACDMHALTHFTEVSDGLCFPSFQSHFSSSQQGNLGKYRSHACSTNNLYGKLSHGC